LLLLVSKHVNALDVIKGHLPVLAGASYEHGTHPRQYKVWQEPRYWPLHLLDFVDLRATRSFNLYGGALGLARCRRVVPRQSQSTRKRCFGSRHALSSIEGEEPARGEKGVLGRNSR
jgi:hypothetical protein